MRRFPPPEAVLTGDGPALISAITDSSGRLRRFHVERFDADTKRLGVAERITLVDTFLSRPGAPHFGRWGVAADDDLAAVVFHFGKSFALAMLDLRETRLRYVRMLESPPEREGFVRVKVGSGSRRFGAAIARSDSVLWLEFDENGNPLVTPLTLDSVSPPDPEVVWNGRNFAFLARRHVDGRVWLGIEEIKEGHSHFLKVALEERGTRTYYPEGRLIWYEDAYVVGARSLSMHRNGRGDTRFELLRVDTDGRVDRRECPDRD